MVSSLTLKEKSKKSRGPEREIGGRTAKEKRRTSTLADFTLRKEFARRSEQPIRPN